jgi:hypothetical protein
LSAPVLDNLVGWDEDGEYLDEHGVKMDPTWCKQIDFLNLGARDCIPLARRKVCVDATGIKDRAV